MLPLLRHAAAAWRRTVRAAVISVPLFLIALTGHAQPVNSRELRLVHLAQNTRPLDMSAATQQWLNDRQRTIRVGVVPNGTPPFDIVDSTGRYLGITANLVDRIRSSAHLRVTFRTFANVPAMLDAARLGDIDLATTVIQTAPDTSGLLYSHAYYPDQDAVVERNHNDGFATIPRPATPRLAYVPSMVSSTTLAQSYPDATLLPVDSPAAGLIAVAFGHADQYVGNTNASNYLIERLQLLNLSIRHFTTYPRAPGFQLAAPAANAPLIALANQLIDQIDNEDLAETRSRWEGRPNHIALDMATVLNPAEQAWIQAHPVVYFSVDHDISPYLFHDDNGNFAGVTADMMHLITDQVGIRFEPIRGPLPHDAIVILPVLNAGAAKPGFVTTSPYSWSGFGIVTRAGLAMPRPTKWPHDRRIAVPDDGTADTLPDTTQRTDYLVTPTVTDALHAVSDGDVDAAIININVANYYIAQHYRGALVISGYLGPSMAAQIGFGVPDSSPELATIISKVLLGTREAQLNDIRNHWNFSGIPDAAFRPWRQRVWVILCITVSFGALLLAWNRSLSRQIRLRKQAETTLKQQSQLQQTLLDSMPFPFFICDFELQLRGWNQAFETAVGSARCEVGRPLCSLASDEDDVAEHLTDILQRASATHQPQFKDTSLRVKAREIDVHAWVVPFVSDSHDKGSLLAGWMDVSERGEMQRAAKQAMEEAESANHAKSTFLATISHEIRTPMNAILGILELRVRDAERQSGTPPEDLQAALESARSLISMLDEILDISKIEAGKLTIHPQPMYLNPLTNSVAAIYEEVAKKKGLMFHYASTAHTRQVMTDGLRLRQILGNALSNAIKFTAHGTISFSVSVDAPASSDEVTRVRFDITDTGIGIDPALLPSLLKPYTQAAPDTAAHYGGTGLGLPICHSLTTALGGTLTLNSQPGQGTRVSLHFVFQCVPVAVSSPIALAPAPEDPALYYGRTALIVDDHAPNRIVLSRQLEFIGLRTVVCGLANEALEVLDQTHVDILITDCNMPGMNGFELTRAVRQREAQAGTHTPLVIVGFTASLLPQTYDLATANGMDACLTKPLALDELSDTLRRLLHIKPPGATANRAPNTTTAPTSSIVDQVTRLAPADAPEMLRSLVEACETDIQTLQDAVAQGNIEAIGAVSHRIHATAKLCNLPVLAQLAELADTRAGEQPPAPLAELEELSNAIMTIMRRLIDKLLARTQQQNSNDAQ